MASFKQAIVIGLVISVLSVLTWICNGIVHVKNANTALWNYVHAMMVRLETAITEEVAA